MHKPFAFLTELERVLGTSSASITVPIAKLGSSIAPDQTFSRKSFGSRLCCMHMQERQAA